MNTTATDVRALHLYAELRGHQHRVYWRNPPAEQGPRKSYLPFASRDEATAFIALVRLRGLEAARALAENDPPAVTVVPPASGTGTVGVAATSSTGLQVVGFTDLWEVWDKQTHAGPSRAGKDSRRQFRNHLEPYWGNTDITAMISQAPLRRKPLDGPDGQPLTVQGWINWLGQRHGFNKAGQPTTTLLSPKTIRNLYGLASMIFSYALKDEEAIVRRNPFKGVTLPTVEAGIAVHLEKSGVDALLHNTPRFWLPLITFLLGTGVRWGEAAGLTVGHVHLDAVRPHVNILKGCKRGPRGGMVLGTLKSTHATRVIYLDPHTAAAMRTLRPGKHSDDRVFTTVTGAPLHHSNFTDRVLKPALEACGDLVPPGTTSHNLRHTHASWLLAQNVPLISVQRRLGHSDISTTMKHYAHLMGGHDAGAVAATGNLLRPEGAFAKPGARPVSPALADLHLDEDVTIPHPRQLLTVQERELPELEDHEIAA